MTGVRKGDDMYWLTPTPLNKSDRELMLIALTPDTTSLGLEFVDARIYRRSDFLNEAPPLGWGGKYSFESGSPALVKSVPVAGRTIAAGQGMDDDVVMFHLRVTTDQFPLRASGVKVLYEQKGLRRFQILPATFELYE